MCVQVFVVFFLYVFHFFSRFYLSVHSISVCIIFILLLLCAPAATQNGARSNISVPTVLVERRTLGVDDNDSN